MKEERRIIRKKKREDSNSFQKAVISLIVLILGYNEIGLPGNLADNITGAIAYGNGVKIALAFLAAVPVIIRIRKRIKNKKWNWNFWKERNFLTQVSVTVIIGLYFFGALSETQHVELIAAATYAINMISQFAKESPAIPEYIDVLDIPENYA